MSIAGLVACTCTKGGIPAAGLPKHLLVNLTGTNSSLHLGIKDGGKSLHVLCYVRANEQDDPTTPEEELLNTICVGRNQKSLIPGTLHCDIPHSYR